MNRNDTRSRIQDVALQMFIDKGYEATSLREIAEELGVTKAALYYHFDTKEKIVTSLIDDRVERLEALVEWGRTLPKTPAGRAEFIRGYAKELHEGRHVELIPQLRELIARHPLRENLHGQLMRALARSGQRAEALTAFQEKRAPDFSILPRPGKVLP